MLLKWFARSNNHVFDWRGRELTNERNDNSESPDSK